MESPNKLSFDFASLKTNAKVISFSICLFLAAGIWTVNTLNKEHQTEIKIKLLYSNSKYKIQQHGMPLNEIAVTLRGRGFDLAEYLLFNRKKVIEVNSDRIFKSNEKIESTTLVESELLKFKGEIKIEKISPETVSLPNRKSYFKKVAIKPIIKFSYEKMFMQSGPMVTVPDSLMLSSTSPIPETLTSINTMPLEVRGVKDFVFRSTMPDLRNLPDYIPEKSKIWILVPVEMGTESIIDIPITTSESNRYIKFIPAVVSVKCRVPLSKYEQTTSDLFKVEAKLNPDGTSKAVVALTVRPSWADQISWQPASVDYFHQIP
jgi:hypothetical protein